MIVLQGTTYAAQLVAGTDLTGSTVSCTVTAPDGTTATYSTTAQTVTITTSTATANIPATQVGTYLIVWTLSGLISGGQSDQFTVEAPTLSLVSLAELKPTLRIQASDSSQDELLRLYMEGARSVVENITGALLPSVRTQVFPGRTSVIVLPERWVSAVTSVLESNGPTTVTLTEQTFGTAATGYSYLWDRSTNILTRSTTWGSSLFAALVSVTYTAGLTTIPADIRIAASELIKHWYQKMLPFRAGTPFGSAGGDDATVVGNYLVPNAVMELLEPWRRPPGIA